MARCRMGCARLMMQYTMPKNHVLNMRVIVNYYDKRPGNLYNETHGNTTILQ